MVITIDGESLVLVTGGSPSPTDGTIVDSIECLATMMNVRGGRKGREGKGMSGDGMGRVYDNQN